MATVNWIGGSGTGGTSMSEDFDSSTWGFEGGMSVVKNGVANPINGALTADTVTWTGPYATFKSLVGQSYTAGDKICFSLYARKASWTSNFKFYLQDSGFVTQVDRSFDVGGSAGTFTAVDGNSKVTDLGNGWLRISGGITVPGTGTYFAYCGVMSLGAQSMDVWGAQLERGSLLPTTYKPDNVTAAWPLDGLTQPPDRAWSLRKLTTPHTKAITVKRDSDGTTLDIGFTAGGDLDEAAITAFTGTSGTSYGWVTQYWDCFGRSHLIAESQNQSFPLIVKAGVVVKRNGKPALLFENATVSGSNGTNSWGSYLYNTALPTDLTSSNWIEMQAAVSLKAATPTNSSFIAGNNDAVNPGGLAWQFQSGTKQHGLIHFVNEGSFPIFSAALADVQAVNVLQVEVNATGTGSGFNGGVQSGTQSSGFSPVTTTTNFLIGGDGLFGNTFEGYISEVLYWRSPTQLNSTDRSASYSNANTYWAAAAGGATYSVSATETAAALESSVSVLALAAASTEVATAIDAQTATETRLGAITEAATAIHAQTNTWSGAWATTEAATATDASTGPLARVGATTETATSTDATSSSMAAAASATELAAQADTSVSSTANGGVDTIETAPQLDASATQLAAVAAASEPAVAVDAQASVLTALAATTEPATATHAQTSSGALTAARSEPATALDSTASGLAAGAAATETALVLDFSDWGGGTIYPASAIEAATAVDAVAAFMAAVASIAEAAGATETLSSGLQAVAASTEAANATDAASAVRSLTAAQVETSTTVELSAASRAAVAIVLEAVAGNDVLTNMMVLAVALVEASPVFGVQTATIAGQVVAYTSTAALLLLL